MANYSYTIHHNNGNQSRYHETYDDAIRALKSEYGDDIVLCDDWDAAGQPGAGDERLLVWASEEDAENDAGQNAIAEISRRKLAD